MTALLFPVIDDHLADSFLIRLIGVFMTGVGGKSNRTSRRQFILFLSNLQGDALLKEL